MTDEEIRRLLDHSPRQTPVQVFLQTDSPPDLSGLIHFSGGGGFYLIWDDWARIRPVLQRESRRILLCRTLSDRHGSAIPLADYRRFSARIEPGAIIRQGVTLAEDVVVMMGAVLNIGASVGRGTMIDMNAVLGARAQVGSNCHIGAGAVLAGTIDPPSAVPVTVGDGVFVGANAVILEGLSVGEGAVLAAGAVLTRDLPAGMVAAGVPARIVKAVDRQTLLKVTPGPKVGLPNGSGPRPRANGSGQRPRANGSGQRPRANGRIPPSTPIA